MENTYFNESTKNLLLSFYEERVPQSVIININSENDILPFSKFLAKYIQCKRKDCNGPCLKCESCRKIEKNIHPDVIYPQKTGITKGYSVATVRQVRADSFILPNESPFKIYIFTDAQNLSIPAQNALLKTLEDTPKGVIFLFFCSNLSKLLSTVKSRSQVFNIDLTSKSNNINEDFENLTKEILSAIVKKNESDLLVIFSKIGSDKELLKKILFSLAEKISEAMSYKANLAKECSGSKILAENFSFEELSCFSSVLSEVNFMLERNVNFNLLSSYFISRLF